MVSLREKSWEIVVNNRIYYISKQGEKNRDYKKKNDSKMIPEMDS